MVAVQAPANLGRVAQFGQQPALRQVAAPRAGGRAHPVCALGQQLAVLAGRAVLHPTANAVV